MREAVIVSAVRTPIGNLEGSLSSLGAAHLGGIVIQEAVKRAAPEKLGLYVKEGGEKGRKAKRRR